MDPVDEAEALASTAYAPSPRGQRAVRLAPRAHSPSRQLTPRGSGAGRGHKLGEGAQSKSQSQPATSLAQYVTITSAPGRLIPSGFERGLPLVNPPRGAAALTIAYSPEKL